MTFNPDAAARPDSGIFGLDTPPNDAAIVLLPVPFDATASYGRRTAQGPQAILTASHQVDLFDRDTGRPYASGIAMLDEPETVKRANDQARALSDQARDQGEQHAAASVAQVNQRSQEMNRWVYETASAWLDRGKIVGVVGGDHSTPMGLIQAYVERHPKMGVLHIDAHADLRVAYEGFSDSHASIMYNVTARTALKKLVQVGIRDFGEGELEIIQNSRGRIVTFFDTDLARDQDHGEPFAKVAARIAKELPKEVYISFDIDGLDPTLCPNTGTPVPGGLSFHQVCRLFEAVVNSGRTIVGFDLNEVAPGADGSEWDANVGARILYKLCGYTLLSRRGRARRRAAAKPRPRARRTRRQSRGTGVKG